MEKKTRMKSVMARLCLSSCPIAEAEPENVGVAGCLEVSVLFGNLFLAAFPHFQQLGVDLCIVIVCIVVGRIDPAHKEPSEIGQRCAHLHVVFVKSDVLYKAPLTPDANISVHVLGGLTQALASYVIYAITNVWWLSVVDIGASEPDGDRFQDPVEAAWIVGL